jgi:hypothetical protein
MSPYSTGSAMSVEGHALFGNKVIAAWTQCSLGFVVAGVDIQAWDQPYSLEPNHGFCMAKSCDRMMELLLGNHSNCNYEQAELG